MGRDFYIHGEMMVTVKGASFGTEDLIGTTYEPVKVEPRFRHQDYHIDDFGPEIPPDVQWMLSDAIIRMTLIHFDDPGLQSAIAATMGGGGPNSFTGAGTPMGAGVAQFASPNQYLQLRLVPGSGGNGSPWRFLFCYLTERPVVWPLGTERSLVELTWRAIPYVPLNFQIVSQGGTPNLPTPGFPIPGAVAGSQVYVDEQVSAGAVLWDYT